jgi:cell filamentation protein
VNKYWVGCEQTECQPGSDELVLANLLDIVDPDEINDVELLLLPKLYDEALTSRLPIGSILVQRRWRGIDAG